MGYTAPDTFASDPFEGLEPLVLDIALPPPEDQHTEQVEATKTLGEPASLLREDPLAYFISKLPLSRIAASDQYKIGNALTQIANLKKKLTSDGVARAEKPPGGRGAGGPPDRR